MQRPVGIDRGSAFEVRPQNDFALRRTEQANLRPGAEALVVDPGGEFLRPFKGLADGRFATLVAGEGEIGTGGSQCGTDRRINNLIEGFLQGGGELQTDTVAEYIERPPLRIVGRRVLRSELVVDALQGARLPRRIEYLLESVPRAGEEEDAILVLLRRSRFPRVCSCFVSCFSTSGATCSSTARMDSQRTEVKAANRVARGFCLPTPTLPRVRVRGGSFNERVCVIRTP